MKYCVFYNYSLEMLFNNYQECLDYISKRIFENNNLLEKDFQIYVKIDF